MNYMFFQTKNNNLIRIQKNILFLNIKQLSPLVSGGSPLLRNYYWILYFQYLFSLFIFHNPKNSAINVGPITYNITKEVPLFYLSHFIFYNLDFQYLLDNIWLMLYSIFN
jgi:hypothetical protein